MVCAYDKGVSPGYFYDSSTKKYSPGDAMHTINIEESILEYKIKIRSKEDLRLIKDSKVIKDALWTQDFDITKFSDCILLKGEKICEYRGNVKPHNTLSVVSSIYHKSYIDMLICFHSKIEQKDIKDLKDYIDCVKEMKMSQDNILNQKDGRGFKRLEPNTTTAFIPPNIQHAFSLGYFYENDKRTEVSSIKYGIEEFCHYLVNSERSRFPVTCKVKYPLPTPQVSYASVVRNEPTVTAHDNVLTGQSYYIDGLHNRDVHTVKPKQEIELPVTHNTMRNTTLKGSNITSFNQQWDVPGKGLEQNKVSKDSKYSHQSMTAKTFSRMPVDKSGEQQLLDSQVSDRKSCHDKGSEIHCPCEVSLDDASIHCSREDISLQSSQTLTRNSECVELNTHLYEREKKNNCKLKSKYSNVQEKQFQVKPTPPRLLHVAGDINNSEKHESKIEESQSKFKDKTVNAQIMSEKSQQARSNLYQFNNSNDESSTLMPDKESEICGIKMKYYGVIPEAEGKTIILLGASGSGKTTLVNFIANYFSDNKSAAGKLIKVISNSNDFQGHTTQITGYTFCMSKDNPLTVIDTPGLNDSSGAEMHDHVQSLKTFLANADSQNLKIHAIGFVAQAHIVRLTSSERLVMDYISSLFGKEIGNHVIAFVTFSDNQETPPVVEAINNYGVSCSVFLKFNNSALSVNKEEEIDELDKIYWRIGCKSWKKCMKLLEKLPALSFKSLMDEIYVTQIIEVAERDLRTEIMSFVNKQRSKVVTKEVLRSAEKIWTLTETVKGLNCINVSQCSTVEDILMRHVKDICTMQNSCLSTEQCMKLLSLSPSRPLLKAGLAIISSSASIYKFVKQQCVESKKLVQKKDTPDVLYCVECMKDHVLKGPESSKGWGWSKNKSITYTCTECSCNEGVHAINENMEQKITGSFGFTPDKLLQHTKNSIEKVLKELCLPEYKIHESEYINSLKCFAKHESQQFCIDLLQKY